MKVFVAVFLFLSLFSLHTPVRHRTENVRGCTEVFLPEGLLLVVLQQIIIMAYYLSMNMYEVYAGFYMAFFDVTYFYTDMGAGYASGDADAGDTDGAGEVAGGYRCPP